MNSISAFIIELKKYRGAISKQELKTLKGQALKGDLVGAKKGLEKVVRKYSNMKMAHNQTKHILKHHEIDYRGQLAICMENLSK